MPAQATLALTRTLTQALTLPVTLPLTLTALPAVSSLRRLVRITGGPAAHGREETVSAASARSSSRCGHAPLKNSRLNDTSPPAEIESCCTSTSDVSSTRPSCSSASVSHCARKRGEARRLDATHRAWRAVRSAAERLSKLFAAIVERRSMASE